MGDALLAIETKDDLRKLLKAHGATDHYTYWKDGADENLVEDQRVEIGGMSGGNCWGDSDPRPYRTGDALSGPNGALFKLLKTHWRDISFFDYYELTEGVTKDENTTVSEYYGNSTEYRVRLIDLQKLLDAIHAKRDA